MISEKVKMVWEGHGDYILGCLFVIPASRFAVLVKPEPAPATGRTLRDGAEPWT